MPAKSKTSDKSGKKLSGAKANKIKSTNLTDLHVMLSHEQSDFLKVFCIKLRAAHGIKISRSEVVRALIEYVMELDLRPREIENIADLEKHLRRCAFAEFEEALKGKGDVDAGLLKELEKSIF
jgi:hypothetical protein